MATVDNGDLHLLHDGSWIHFGIVSDFEITTDDPGHTEEPSGSELSGLSYTALSFSGNLVGVKSNWSQHSWSLALDYTDDRLNIMGYHDIPDDLDEFFEHHESYDYYDNLRKSTPYYSYKVVKDEYEMWKKYPDRPFLRPGRRIHRGTVTKVRSYYTGYDLAWNVTLELEDHNILLLRKPKNADWHVGDVVEVAATVDVMEKPHIGKGHNPRIPGKPRAASKQLSVSDFLEP